MTAKFVTGVKHSPVIPRFAATGKVSAPSFWTRLPRLEELDRYQDGRKSIKFAAYSGTAGAVMALGSSLITNLIISKDQADTRKRVSSILRWTGASITVGSVVYGLNRLSSNEDHLKQSVERFNDAHPDHPIEILFKTEF